MLYHVRSAAAGEPSIIAEIFLGADQVPPRSELDVTWPWASLSFSVHLH
jgi:hypothetical protein